MSIKKLIIATRGSKLALWQSEHIKARLESLHAGLSVQLNVIKTTGDKILDAPLAFIGGKGLFTKELEEAMLRGEAHLAVHSLKDVPTKLADGLTLSAVTTREDDRDCFLSQTHSSLSELPQGAVVGTTSLRRRMQLLAVRSDLEIKDLRGNVDTRIRKLKEGEFDAIILATAGLKRLGLLGEVAYAIPIEKSLMLPPMGQAALGIESVTTPEVLALIAPLNDALSSKLTSFEREFVDALDGGCQVPIAVNAEKHGEQIQLRAAIGLPDGSKIVRDEMTCNDNESGLGIRLAARMIDNGAKELLKEALKMAESILVRPSDAAS